MAARGGALEETVAARGAALARLPRAELARALEPIEAALQRRQEQEPQGEAAAWLRLDARGRAALAGVFLGVTRLYGARVRAADAVELVGAGKARAGAREAVQLVAAALAGLEGALQEAAPDGCASLPAPEALGAARDLARVMLELGFASSAFYSPYAALEPEGGAMASEPAMPWRHHADDAAGSRRPTIAHRTTQYAQHLRAVFNAVRLSGALERLAALQARLDDGSESALALSETLAQLTLCTLQSATTFDQALGMVAALAPAMRPSVALLVRSLVLGAMAPSSQAQAQAQAQTQSQTQGQATGRTKAQRQVVRVRRAALALQLAAACAYSDASAVHRDCRACGAAPRRVCDAALDELVKVGEHEALELFDGAVRLAINADIERDGCEEEEEKQGREGKECAQGLRLRIAAAWRSLPPHARKLARERLVSPTRRMVCPLRQGPAYDALAWLVDQDFEEHESAKQQRERTERKCDDEHKRDGELDDELRDDDVHLVGLFERVAVSCAVSEHLAARGGR